MSAVSGTGAAGCGLSLRMVHTAIDTMIHTYSLFLTIGVGLVTASLAVIVMAGMGVFMLVFISLLVLSAWQAAIPKLWEVITRHSKDSISTLWTSIKEEVLDYLESCIKLLNGKSRLARSSRHVAVELDENGLPVPPHEFICPLTHDIMSDPVTLLTGMTYDRHSIKNWIERGHTTCPMTQMQLSWRMHNRVFAARNYALRHLIDTWISENWPGKDPRTPLGADCRDAVVLFGPPPCQAPAPAPAADPFRHPSAAPALRQPGPSVRPPVARPSLPPRRGP